MKSHVINLCCSLRWSCAIARWVRPLGLLSKPWVIHHTQCCWHEYRPWDTAASPAGADMVVIDRKCWGNVHVFVIEEASHGGVFVLPHANLLTSSMTSTCTFPHCFLDITICRPHSASVSYGPHWRQQHYGWSLPPKFARQAQWRSNAHTLLAIARNRRRLQHTLDEVTVSIPGRRRQQNVALMRASVVSPLLHLDRRNILTNNPQSLRLVVHCTPLWCIPLRYRRLMAPNCSPLHPRQAHRRLGLAPHAGKQSSRARNRQTHYATRMQSSSSTTKIHSQRNASHNSMSDIIVVFWHR